MEPDSKNLVTNRCKSVEVDNPRILNILETIQASLNLQDSSVDLSFVDADEICEINREHRNKNTPTDVLSFPQWNWQSPVTSEEKNPSLLIEDGLAQQTDILLGDIVICPEIANQNAEQINQSLDREITFLTLHGFLHLCGHDHQNEDDEKIMTAEQKRIMEILDRKETGDPLWSNLISRKN